MATTVFAKQSSIYRTTVEGETVKLEGTVNISQNGVSDITGGIYTKEGQYIGSYSERSMQAQQVEYFSYMSEAWMLRIQLDTDLNAKKEELMA